MQLWGRGGVVGDPLKCKTLVKPNTLKSVTVQSRLPTCSVGKFVNKWFFVPTTLSQLCPTPAGFFYSTHSTHGVCAPRPSPGRDLNWGGGDAGLSACLSACFFFCVVVTG